MTTLGPAFTGAEELSVLIFDESVVMRHLTPRALREYPGLFVIGAYGTIRETRDAIRVSTPDVITIELPPAELSNSALLDHILGGRPIPTLLISTVSSEWARGAMKVLSDRVTDYVQSPSELTLRRILLDLGARVHRAARHLLQAIYPDHQHSPPPWIVG